MSGAHRAGRGAVLSQHRQVVPDMMERAEGLSRVSGIAGALPSPAKPRACDRDHGLKRSPTRCADLPKPWDEAG